MAKLKLDITLDDYDMKLAIAQHIVRTYGLQVDDVTDLVKSIDISHVRSEADTFGCRDVEYTASCHYEEN